MTVLNHLRNKKILVIGDVMLDRFWWGEVTRISPEAPVPIVRLNKTTEAVGGAANVAANIAGLGSTAILVGCIGEDPDGRLLPQLLQNTNVSPSSLMVVKTKPTTVKTRVIAHHQHVARVDQESSNRLTGEDEEMLLSIFRAQLDGTDAIVLSDYAKGTLTDGIVAEVIGAAAKAAIPLIVDPKGRDFTKYRGASLLTPNRREAAEAAGIEHESESAVIRAGNELLRELNGTSLLITEGENGMTLFAEGCEPFHTNSVAREVFDVTGAGDTVVAALAVAIANEQPLHRAVEFANLAAGYAVEHVGTTHVTLGMIRGN